MRKSLFLSFSVSILLTGQLPCIAAASDTKADGTYTNKGLVQSAVEAALDDNRDKLNRIYEYNVLNEITANDIAGGLVEDMLKKANAAALELGKKKSYSQAAKRLENAFDLSEYLVGEGRKKKLTERTPDGWLQSWTEAKISASVYIQALNDYGYFLQKNDQNYEATHILQAVVNHAPQREVAYLNLADSLMQIGRKDEAAPYFAKYKELMQAENKASAIPKHVEAVLSLHPSIRPKTGGTETKAPDVGQIDFGPWMAEIQRRIKSNWTPPKLSVSKAAAFDFDVSKAGEISNIETADGGDEAYNKASLAALKASTLPPLPVHAPETIRIRFNFDYNVFESSDSKKIKEWEDRVSKADTADNHAGLAQAFEEAGNYSRAHAEFAKAIELAPSNSYFKTLSDECDKQLSSMEKMSSTYGKQSNKTSKATLPQILLNNEGVVALQKLSFDTAIEKFNQALMLQPGYKLARENLGIAFNNRGLSERKDYQAALKDFHRAVLINPDDATVEKNVEMILASKGISSNNFDALKEKADEAFNKKDYVGALVEYRRALKIKDDMNAQARIAEIIKLVLAPGAKFSDFSGAN